MISLGVVRFVVILAAVAALAGPDCALAGTASSNGAKVFYLAPPGEANHVVVTKDTAGVTVSDSGATVVAGDGCATVSASQVFCAGSRRMGVLMRLDDMDDFAQLVGWYTTGSVDGGTGADTLIGGTSGNLLVGGAGDDILDGRSGPDYLQGGSGTDLLDGGSAADVADYSDRTAPVAVDLDGVADDGEPGEADVLEEIENLRGGEGNDVFVGDGNPNWLWGLGGADVVSGLGGADTVVGGEGSDTLNGNAGSDRVWGTDANDRLRGGGGPDELLGSSGSDVLDGGNGRDEINGERGDDTIRARDGRRDIIHGGAHTDRARIDWGLDSVSSIESFF
jgi:Ca2+-binding RTX toxin-like protein